MGPGTWLRLTDYASKYRVSISTLRRRIKAGELPHRFEDGKYLIFDQTEPQNDDLRSDHKSLENEVNRERFAGATFRGQPVENVEFVEPYYAPAGTIPNEEMSLMFETQERLDQLRSIPNQPAAEQAEPILSSANRLLGELKRAYMNILQEKEEQMIQLKEEVSDLKMLVRVLEDDNDRLRRVIGAGVDSHSF